MSTRNIIGWLAVALVTLVAGFWAFWGTIEAYHEGWCQPTLGLRLLQLAAYLAMPLLLTAFAALSLRWPRLGATLFLLVGLSIAAAIVGAQAQFGWFITTTITAVPILAGLMFLYGRPTPRRLAYAVAVGVPLATVILSGAEPVYRVSTRYDDGERGERLVEGNGVTLIWAPAGPGWDRDGNVTWGEALERVRYLADDGMTLADAPQDLWRLPTRDEIVRSLTRHNQNAGGAWEHEQARYQRRPDKESPLWDPHAPLIYLWTCEEADDDRAWIVVYHGGIHSKPKNLGAASNGFRAVRDPPTNNSPGETADGKHSQSHDADIRP